MNSRLHEDDDLLTAEQEEDANEAADTAAAAAERTIGTGGTGQIWTDCVEDDLRSLLASIPAKIED